MQVSEQVHFLQVSEFSQVDCIIMKSVPLPVPMAPPTNGGRYLFKSSRQIDRDTMKSQNAPKPVTPLRVFLHSREAQPCTLDLGSCLWTVQAIHVNPKIRETEHRCLLRAREYRQLRSRCIINLVTHVCRTYKDSRRLIVVAVDSISDPDAGEMMSRSRQHTHIRFLLCIHNVLRTGVSFSNFSDLQVQEFKTQRCWPLLSLGDQHCAIMVGRKVLGPQSAFI